ncbi:uncharacterized protein LOC125039405 [Penaeus chinensis]|uniref:uncharacterized protein LOC125039405 n=1 Tax=Penaeus chinensis TaxID=139456 RepID=UPI001FB63E1C|nr:uncharacterized protein LOC125039405 [Penaeus chinensis]
MITIPAIMTTITLQSPDESLSLSRNTLGHGYPLNSPHPLTAARSFPPGVSAWPVGYGSRIGQGCVQSIVDGMDCAHGTNVDTFNMRQCAKGLNETCGGAWGEHVRCTAKLHCFVGKCRIHTWLNAVLQYIVRKNL